MGLINRIGINRKANFVGISIVAFGGACMLFVAGAYNIAVHSAQEKIPYAAEFLKLYPDCHSGFSHYDGTVGFDPTFYMITSLYDRYVLDLRIEVKLNKTRTTVISYGEPEFFLLEITDVSGRRISYGDLQRRFGRDEWKKLVKASGDFKKLDIHMQKDQPAPGFKNQWRDQPTAF